MRWTVSKPSSATTGNFRARVSAILRTICNSSRRRVSLSIDSTELLLQRCMARFRHCRYRPRAIDGDDARQRAHQPRVLALDGLELRGGFVALELDAARTHP